MSIIRRTLGVVTIASCAALAAIAADKPKVDMSKVPPAAKKQVDYAKDIKPLIERSCAKCHGAEKQKGKYRLDNREAAIKGGESGDAAIIPGKSDKSPLVHYISHAVEDMEMPPDPKKNKPLTKEEIGLFRAWIDQGAKF
jgi:uncharacterized membrane protein